jgi:hypothetical protein
VLRCGQERAEGLFRRLVGNYRRLALISTSQSQLEQYRDYTEYNAEKLGQRYEEVLGV